MTLDVLPDPSWPRHPPPKPEPDYWPKAPPPKPVGQEHPAPSADCAHHVQFESFNVVVIAIVMIGAIALAVRKKVDTVVKLR